MPRYALLLLCAATPLAAFLQQPITSLQQQNRRASARFLPNIRAAANGINSKKSQRLLPPEVFGEDSSTVRYFAFGSNLLASKMDGRGDTEVIARTRAAVAEHRLAFNMRMFPPLEPAMASIEPSSGETCEGVLYTLTREGYEALWQSEGGSMDRPGYEEIVVNTTVCGRIVPAITLRAAPWMRLRRDAPPSARYKGLILSGAKEIGLSDDYVRDLAALPVASPSGALTAIARAHGVVAILLFKLGLRQALTPLRAACYALLRGRRTLVAQPVAQPAALASRILDLAAEIATAALLLPTAALGAAIRLALSICGKENWVQFGPPPRKEAAGEDKGEDKGEAKGAAPPPLAATSRSGTQAARMSATDEPPRQLQPPLQDLSELRDLAELKHMRDAPISASGLLPAVIGDGLVLPTGPPAGDATRDPRLEAGGAHWPRDPSEAPVQPRAANRKLGDRKLGDRKLGRRRRGGSAGSDAVSDAVARWAAAEEAEAVESTDGEADSKRLSEVEESRKAVEAMLAGTAQVDVLAAAPASLVDVTAQALQAAEAAEAEAAAAVARAAALREAANKSVAGLQAAAAREQMSQAMAAWASREEAEQREEEALRAAMERAMGGSRSDTKPGAE